MPHPRRRPTARLTIRVAALAAGAALLLTGCPNQPESANDNGPQKDPVQPGDVVRDGK